MGQSLRGWLVIGLLLALGGACGSEADLDAEGSLAESGLSGFEKPGRVPADADLSVAPEGQLSFWIMGNEWRADVQAPLYQGSFATLSVAPERLAGCGEAPTVTATLVPDTGGTVELGLTRPEGSYLWTARFAVPVAARELTLWLRAEDGQGCVVWDSAQGRNHHFIVHRWAPTVVHFRSDWTEATDGPVLKGGVLVIDYALERLPNCRVVYRGFQGWDIIAHARIDGVELPGHSVVLSMAGSGYGANAPRERALAFFAIPWQAERIELWFENNQYPPTCREWDSDFGRNYRFTPTAAGSQPPGARLIFAAQWWEYATGPLFGGAQVSIVAHPSRFPHCGTRGAVSGGVRHGDGTVVNVALDSVADDGSRSGETVLPTSGDHVDLWLHAHNADGCDEFDSAFGSNYPFALLTW